MGWNRSEGFFGITDDDKAAWATAYPAVDLSRQLAAAGEWLKANPTKATKSNWRKFITSWLSRSQDRGGDTAINRPAKPQRGYQENLELP